MGLLGYLVRVPSSELADVRARPRSAWDALDTRLRLASEMLQAIDDGEADLENDDEIVAERFGVFELDKAWHGLCSLLHGLGVRHVLMNAATIDGSTEVHVGGGAPRFTVPEQVRSAATALGAITEAALLDAYDPERFRRDAIYPDIWDDDGEATEFLAERFAVLVRCFEHAAAKGEAVLFFVR